uniref:A-kinase anchor protein 17A n=2 Tax=Wuchereria bancrofti TaxID=6293 RepID=A0AAF5Q018_WUCBA
MCSYSRNCPKDWNHEKDAPISMADELEPLCIPVGLYVKPSARMTVTVCLPPLKQPGQSISNWDLMEKIKKAVSPIELSSIRVMTSTIELVRFEAELPNRKILAKVIKALDGYTLKVMGFFEPLKVRAAEAKSDFPTRHDWDEFFRNSDNMNELEPGERPDTIYLAKMPSNWFKECGSSDDSMPNEHVLQNVFERFGTVRCVDIPVCDPYRRKMSSKISGIRTTGFSFGQEVLFEGYVQFVEYISFVRAMDFLRNKKLVKKMSDDRIFEAAIKVDFDKSKHLSNKNIHKRYVERERLKELEKQKISEECQEREKGEGDKTNTRKKYVERKSQREEKHSRKRNQKRQLKKEHQLNEMIAEEERKLVIARRKLESKRLLSALFWRIEAKLRKKDSRMKMSSRNLEEDLQSELETKLRQALLREQEQRLRKRIEAKMMLGKSHVTNSGGRQD